MRRQSTRRSVGERVLQNASGIEFEIQKLLTTVADSRHALSATDHVRITRIVERLRADAETLGRLAVEMTESESYPIAG